MKFYKFINKQFIYDHETKNRWKKNGQTRHKWFVLFDTKTDRYQSIGREILGKPAINLLRIFFLMQQVSDPFFCAPKIDLPRKTRN